MSKLTYGLTITPKSLTITAGNTVLLTGTLTSKQLLSLSGSTATPVRNVAVALYEIVKSGGAVSGIALAAKGITDGTGKHQIRITPAAGIHTYKVIYKNASGEELASSDESLINVTKPLRTLPGVRVR